MSAGPFELCQGMLRANERTELVMPKTLIILETPSHDLERAQFGLRMAVCRRCSARPVGSEDLGADAPRACEKECQLFVQLPRLLHAGHCIDPTVGSFQRIMKGHLKQLALSPAARGDESRSASCGLHPWAVQTQPAVDVLHNLIRN